ncbi:MAG: type II toxin-antitoxin system VapC family toxin [Egibacteraceae bacterium]
MLDASVIVPFLLDEGDFGQQLRGRLTDDSDQSVPHVLDVEVTHALRRLSVVQGVLEAERARAALDDLADLPLTRYPHGGLLSRVWELRHTVTTYDGVYIALAEALGCPLVTADTRLAKAPGIRCEVEVLTTGS